MHLKDSLSSHSFDHLQTSAELENVSHLPHALPESFLDMTHLSISNSILPEEFNIKRNHGRSFTSSFASADGQGFRLDDDSTDSACDSKSGGNIIRR